MKKALLYLVIAVVGVAWFWPSPLKPKAIMGHWIDDPSYHLEVRGGSLRAYNSDAGFYAGNPLFTIGWRMERGSIILSFPPQYTGRVCRFFGWDRRQVEDAMAGGVSIVLRKDGEPIYRRVEIPNEYGRDLVQLERIPIGGLKYRYERPDRGPPRLMIGKRVFDRQSGPGS